ERLGADGARTSLRRGAAPPRRPRFPCTTLFRSPCLLSPTRQIRNSPDEEDPLPPPAGGRRRRRPARRRPVQGRLDPRHRRPQRGDRKSTRLNSSHVKISYAVFCLKKKTVDAARH